MYKFNADIGTFFNTESRCKISATSHYIHTVSTSRPSVVVLSS